MLPLNKSFFCVIPFITISSLAYADVIYTDADFISPSGPIKSGDGIGNVIINTSDTIQPHVVSVAPDYALTAADGSTLTVNNEGQFIIDGWKGIFAQNLKNDGSISQVFLDGPGEIVINEQYGIDAFDKSELISNSKIIINAQFGGLTGAGSTQVVFNNEVDINVATGIGVFLANGDPNNLASIDFMDKATIHTDTGSAVQAIGGYGVDVPTSTITFHNGLEASVEHGNVLESSNDSTVTVNGDSHLWAKDRYGMVALSQDNGTININGKATVLGDFLAQYDGTINLDFKDGSEMTGAIFLNLNYSTGGVVNAKMTGSIWNMNRSSEVTSLDLTITWSSLQIFLMPPPTLSTLTSDTLVGSGTFQLRTDLIAGQGDKLIINNSSAGNHTLIINNQGDVNTDGTEKLTVVETGDGGAKFALGNAVEIGAFEYGLQRTKVNPPTATWTAPPTTYQIASKSNSIATTPC